MSAQLPLGLRLRESARFDNFVVGPNTAAVASVRACASGGDPPLIFLWGQPGSGRSHLLQAACHTMAGSGGEVAYLPLAGEMQLAPAMLAGLERATLICIDDLDAVTGQTAWEAALFSLVNRVLEQGSRLLVCAQDPPRDCGIAMPDLRSRLSLSAVFHLQSLDDAQKLRVLQAHAQARGLELGDEAGQYLLRHAPRDLPSLLRILERLDRASLAAQRRLSVPFVREVLGRDDQTDADA